MMKNKREYVSTPNKGCAPLVLNNRLPLAVAISMALSSFSIGAHAQTAGPIEEVLVQGFRQSIKSSADFKGASNSIVDAITSEELGKFPDGNIAESLQRVPGVAIARGRGGSGRFVTVRGLGEQFNAVTYNGRLLATENGGREFSFDNIASELVARAEVYKSPETRHGDGSIGGRVNLVSAKPLDKAGFQSAFTVAGSNDELSGDTGSEISGVFSNSFADDTVGVLFSINYLQKDFRVDVAESIDTFTIDIYDAATAVNASTLVGAGESSLQSFVRRPVPVDAAGDPIPLVGNARYTSASFGTTTEERERLGGSLAVQFQPNDNLDIVFDALYTNFQSPGNTYTSSHYPCPDCISSDLRDVSIADNNVLTAYTWDQPAEYVSRFSESDTTTWQFGFNLDWQVTDTFKLNGDVSISEASGRRDNIGSDAGSGDFFVIGSQTTAVHSYQHTGREVPDFRVAIDPYNATLAGPDVNAAPISPSETGQGLNPRIFGAHFTRVSFNDIEDKVNSIKVDGSWEFADNGSLHFGADYVDRTKDVQFSDNFDRWCNSFCGNSFSLRGFNPEIFDSMLVDFPADNFLEDAGADIPNGFIAFDTRRFRDLYSSVNQGDPVLDAEGNPLAGNPTHDFTSVANSSGGDIFTATLREQISNELNENVFGFYTQLNVDGEVGDIPWHANVGLRIARTDLTSKGAVNQISNIEIVSGGDQTISFTDAVPVSVKNTYTDVLPAFNITFDLADDVFLRFASSETITRPTLSALTTAENVTSTNLSTEAITTGNPELSPTRSKNTDLSLEWYGENMTGAVAVFYKEIDGFISNTVSTQRLGIGEAWERDFTVTRPENGESATVGGLELAWTHLFDNGLGYQLNYTFAGSTAVDQDGRRTTLENLSENTYNVSGFYENGPLSLRLSYNFRDDFVRTTQGKQGLTEITDSYDQFDLTASYDVLDNITVFFEAANLTGEDEFVFFDGQPNLTRYYEERGAQYNFGVRGKF